MNVTEERLRRATWQNTVAVTITDPVTQRTEYLILPRNSYLPAADLPLADAKSRTPLPQHYPVGVLYDMAGSAYEGPWQLEVITNDNNNNSNTKNNNNTLTPEQLRGMFQDSVKEAVYLRQGSTQALLQLSVADTDQLWEAVVSHSYDLFRQVILSLDPDATPRAVPVKIMVRGEPPISLPVQPSMTLAEVMDLAGADGTAVPIVQGLSFPGHTSIFWLWKVFMHQDNFLYIIANHSANKRTSNF
jgi:hypothetical protein